MNGGNFIWVVDIHQKINNSEFYGKIVGSNNNFRRKIQGGWDEQNQNIENFKLISQSKNNTFPFKIYSPTI